MNTKALFIELVQAIQQNSQLEEVKVSGASYGRNDFGELTLLLDYNIRDDLWIPEGISFDLFGKEFFLTPDGTISVFEDFGNGEDVYALIDTELLATIKSFLTWRLGCILKLKV